MTRSASLTQAIITTINSGLGCAWRNNTVGVWDAKKKLYRASRDRSAIGTADVVACVGGRYYEFEVKVGQDKQSKDQVNHQQRVLDAGGEYFVIQSTDDFLYHASRLGWINNGIRRKAMSA
jgi:hypothetical protein